METNTEFRKKYNTPFHQAALPNLSQSGRKLKEGSTEFRLKSAALRTWNRKSAASSDLKTATSLDHTIRLQAENQALHDEIRNLRVQWDVLKTTLGILSASVCQQENHS